MRKFNFSEFIWFLILFCFEYLIVKMFMSEKIFLIISRDMKAYVILAIILLFLILVIQFFNIFKTSTRRRFKGGYLIFIFALVILNIANGLNINQVSLNLKGVKLYHDRHKESEHNHLHSDEKLNSNEALVFTEKNFHSSLEELILHLEDFVGKEISIEGLLYVSELYEKEEFAITQIDMTCCIADSVYLGVLCKGDLPDLKNGSEIKVKGLVESKKIKNSAGEEIEIPFINVFYTDTLQ
ncbi:hypothetical protein SCB17_002874 [Clostridium perfringens]|nr:hypothetical protein [Clostridium perfringens]MDU3845677.1 hypothetical protein [Clostridium perfringens]